MVVELALCEYRPVWSTGFEGPELGCVVGGEKVVEGLLEHTAPSSMSATVAVSKVSTPPPWLHTAANVPEPVDCSDTTDVRSAEARATRMVTRASMTMNVAGRQAGKKKKKKGKKKKKKKKNDFSCQQRPFTVRS